MKALVFALLLVVGASSTQTNRTFTGAITDSMCASADHSGMRMGSTDGECTIACVDAHGASYVLFDGKDVYSLTDQHTPEKFAGKKVTITGKLNPDTKTIEVATIMLAQQSREFSCDQEFGAIHFSQICNRAGGLHRDSICDFVFDRSLFDHFIGIRATYHRQH